MTASRKSIGYDPGINWGNLVQYATAVSDFTRTAAPEMPASTFARSAAIDWDSLPTPRAFRLADGGYLGLRHYSALGSGRTLVLVHGSACFGDQLHEMARAIAAQGIAEVFTLSMRGHGLSGGPRGHAVATATQMVDDVEAFIRRLKSDRPHQPVFLAGHSAGGGLVLGFSRTPAERLVSGFVFLAPFLGLGSPVNRPHFGGWVKLRGLMLRALVVANLFNITRFNDTTVVDFNAAACAREPRFTPSWSFNTMLAFGPGRWRGDAAPIAPEKPVLLLSGTDDECFLHELYPEAFEVVAPHAEIPDIGTAGHFDLLVEPRAFAALSLWLSKQPAYRRASPPATAAVTASPKQAETV